MLSAERIAEETTRALDHLDDLAVVLLFSVFEASVREHLERAVAPEVEPLTHPVMRRAAEDAIDGIREGEFL